MQHALQRLGAAVILCYAAIGMHPGQTQAAGSFELLDGDRVVLVGDELIERAQNYGYLEATLTTRWPDHEITFRNLGWSGDTVGGESRTGIGSTEQANH